MSNYKLDVRKFTLIFFSFLILSNQLYSRDLTASDKIIFSGPNPFSLDNGSAIYCISLLKNNRFLEKNKIVEVQTVWSWFLEHDVSYPEGHRNRYDIIVNGNPIDWDNSYIEYGGEMLNLRLLFLYRNQYPPENLEYYLMK